MEIEAALEWARVLMDLQASGVEGHKTSGDDSAEPPKCYLQGPTGDIVAIMMNFGSEQDKDASALQIRLMAQKIGAVCAVFISEVWMFGGPPERGEKLHALGMMPSEDAERREGIMAVVEVQGAHRMLSGAIERDAEGTMSIGKIDLFRDDKGEPLTTVGGRFSCLLPSNQVLRRTTQEKTREHMARMRAASAGGAEPTGPAS